MKKYFKYVLLLIIFIFSLTSCFSQSLNKEISKSLGIKIPKKYKVEYNNTHGGFHGDGETTAKIYFDTLNGENIISQISNNKDWNVLPLSENLNLIMYDGTRDGIEYSYNFAERMGISPIKNGYWIFVDRHSESASSNQDVDLFDQSSFNFTLGLYDADTNTLYYLEFDT